MLTAQGKELYYEKMTIVRDKSKPCPNVGEYYDGCLVVGIEQGNKSYEYIIYSVYPQGFDPYH